MHGGLLGHRFLMLEHTGRRSGIRRRNVLEVLECDEDSATVMSGFGASSNWLRNVTAEPSCVVTLGRTRRHTIAEVVTLDVGAALLGRFATAHLRAFGGVCRLWSLDPDDPSTPGRLVQLAPVVVFHLADVAPVGVLCRQFEVEAGLDEVWDALADVAAWPSWARHIRSVAVDPPGTLTASTSGRFRLAGGVTSRFTMSRFEPGRHWTWTGRLLSLTIHYEHAFEAITPDRTRLSWTIGTTGWGRGTLGRLFARIYGWQLDRAIPRFRSRWSAVPARHHSAGPK